MIDFGLINQWELLKTFFTGTSVVEFNYILLKASGKNFEFIQTDFNDNICISTDEKSDEVNAWKNNKKRKLDS